ncbi:hypothetical protein BBK36DRAFT_62536, partial [Trichoderma citrinoviride]
GEVKLKYIPTDKIVANRLTKPLGKDRFTKFYKALGLRKLIDVEIASKEV